MTAYLTIAPDGDATFSLADLDAFVRQARKLKARDDYPVLVDEGGVRVQVHVARRIVPPVKVKEKPAVIQPKGIRSRARKRTG